MLTWREVNSKSCKRRRKEDGKFVADFSPSSRHNDWLNLTTVSLPMQGKRLTSRSMAADL
jgi:hypothetical protein